MPRASGTPVAIGIALAGALLYATTVAGDYVLDDLGVVWANPVVRDARPLGALSEPYWPGRPDIPNWRPAATASWALERGLAGEAAAPLHHAVNALLHGAVVLALFPLARRLTGSVRGAWLACALFALHPAHSEVVAPIMGRTDLLAGLGGLLLVECWCRHRESGALGWLAAACGAALLGLGGKESAAPMLLLLPLADGWLLGRPWRALFGRGLLAYLPLGAIALAYLAGRALVLGETSFQSSEALVLPAVDRLGFTGRNTLYAVWLLLLPTRFHHAITTLPSDLAFTFPLPEGGARWLWAGLALPFWLGWIPLARRAPRAAFCWLGALVPWLPVSGLLPMGACVALRYLFVSTAFAACGAVLAGQALLRQRPAWRLPLLGLAGAWAAGALLLTVLQLPSWRDNQALYRSVLAVVPDSYTANYGLGAWVAQHEADYEQARVYLQRAIRIAGDSPAGLLARLNLATTYEFPLGSRERYGRGARLEQARRVYDEALALSPDDARAHLGAGMLSLQLYDRARRAGREARVTEHAGRVVAHLERVLALEPEHEQRASLNATLGEMLAALGRRDEARARYRKAARWHGEAGEREAARRDLEAAMALDPGPAERAELEAERERWGGR